MQVTAYDLSVKVERNRGQQKPRLQTCNSIEGVGRPGVQKPDRQKFPRSKREEVPHHHHNDRRFDAVITVRIKQVGKAGQLLRDGGEYNHAI